MLLNSLRRPSAFYKNLFALALPIMLQNMITTSLGFVDTFMVGLVGSNELSAVTAANSPVFLMQMITFGLMSGLTILASQYWGKGDVESINRALGVALYMATIVTCGVSAVCYFQSHWVMGMVTNNQTLIDIGAPYLKIVGISLIFNTIGSVYIAMQRSTENSKFGMKVFTCSMLLNTALNYCLIFGNFGAPQLGVMGAAVATLTSRVVELVIVVVYIKCNHRIPLTPKLVLCPGKASFVQFFKTSLPVLINETIWGMGTTAMVAILGHMTISADMLAAYAIVGNVDKVAVTICIGMASSSAVLVGKAIGEGQSVEEVQSLGVCLLSVSMLGGFFVAGLLLLLLPTVFQGLLFPLFALSEQAVTLATTMTIAFACIMPMRSFDFTSITGVLRAGGDVTVAMVIDVVPLWLFSIPLTALCALVLDAPIFLVCLGIQGEAFVKMPVGAWRIHTKKWIHNLTQEVEG